MDGETLLMIFVAFVVGVAFGRITEMDKEDDELREGE